MRIDAYNQIAQIYGTQKTTRTRSTQESGSVRDQISISQAGRDYQIAKSAVSESSDVREDKVAQLKAQVDSGEYHVEPGKFAEKLLEKYKASMIEF